MSILDVFLFMCGEHGVWMGVGCHCPPIRNDIVTPRHLLETKLCIFDVPKGAPLHLSPLITTDEGLFAHQELMTKANALGELLPIKGTVPFCPVVGQIGTP